VDQPLLAGHTALCARYKPIRIRVVELSAKGLDLNNLDYPSKLGRRAALIERGIANGNAWAQLLFSARSL
jgi:hypothetical protein